MRHTQVVGFLVLSLLGVLAHTAASDTGRGAAAIQLDNAWMRRTSTTGQVEQGGHGGSTINPEESALYVTVRNHGSEPDALLSASSEVATAGVLHETMSRENTTVRQPQKQFDIPAGGTLEMKPGGTHITLLGLKQALSPGETVPVLLIFQKAGPIAVEALVK
jgi:copper(I)-binding protein